MNIREFIEKSNLQEDEVWIAGGVGESAIATVEKAIGVGLPDSYRSFLKEFGGIYVMDQGISGIVESDPLAMSGGGIYGDTMFMRADFEDKKVPDYLWVVQKHENGAYCFNFNIPTVGDEFAIVNYEPHLPVSTYSEVLAATFPEFVRKWFFGYLA